MIKVFVSFFFVCAALFAQHDFLNTDEADQVRLVQEPNERLNLYTMFARRRLDEVQSLFKEKKPGRAGTVHDLLDQYSKVIDAIDTVADDALERKLDISVGMKAVAAAEKGFLPILDKIQRSQAEDRGRYEFMLTQAIETTRDSLETANEDLGKRANEVTERERREKKEREGMMQPKDLEATKAAEAKQATEDSNKKKKPTLLKPGETIKDQKTQ